jgi:hypothetical protein
MTSNLSGGASVTDELTALIEQQLAVLNQTYPAWRITRVRRSDGTPGGWWATRHKALTDDQRAAGLVPSIARGDAVALVMELAVQDEIAHQTANMRFEQAPATPVDLGRRSSADF